MGSRSILLIVSTVLLLEAAEVRAHPLLKDSHDRFITVRLQEGSKPDQVRVHILYRLEVHPFTVTEDMFDYRDQVNPGLSKTGLEYFAEYARIYADIIARNLQVQVNGKALTLHSGERSQTLNDEATREPLGHLRCIFNFEAEFPVNKEAENRFDLHETNFRNLAGQIFFSFVNEAKITIRERIVPDPALNKLGNSGQADRLRQQDALAQGAFCRGGAEDRR